MDDTRTRFLAAIAAQLPAERIAEIHLFAPIRQGGIESGVAVVALEHDALTPHASDGAEPESLEPEQRADADLALPGDDGVSEGGEQASAEPREEQRYTVCTARYRHTLKGPDRGKWEATVTEEADAPLVTVDAVVRGVQRRSGDVDEIVRLTGAELRSALPAPAPQSA